MPAPALHVLCAELGLIAYAPGFLTDPLRVIASALPSLDRIFVALVMGKDPHVGPVPFGFITNGNEGLICTLRGTQMPQGSWVEWLDDFDAFLEACPWAPGCRWHRGFGRVYSTLTVDGKKLADVLFGYRKACATAVWVHGHSLGGPLATYAAGEALLEAPILFATPKAGDSALRDRLRGMWPAVVYSYANPNDAVPKVPITVDEPFKIEDFEQVAPLITLPAGSVAPPVPGDWGQSHNLANYLRLLQALP